MNIHFKLSSRHLREALSDLRRPHPYAAERLGFLTCRVSDSSDGLLVLVTSYIRVPDEQYVEDDSAGCFFDAQAMRTAMQHSLSNNESIFHVHLHEHKGMPGFSRTDLRESAAYIPDFWHVTPQLPHGTVVLSLTHAAGLCWYPGHDNPLPITKVSAVGSRMLRLGGTQ
jgi:hypothetical protein